MGAHYEFAFVLEYHDSPKTQIWIWNFGFKKAVQCVRANLTSIEQNERLKINKVKDYFFLNIKIY